MKTTCYNNVMLVDPTRHRNKPRIPSGRSGERSHLTGAVRCRLSPAAVDTMTHYYDTPSFMIETPCKHAASDTQCHTNVKKFDRRFSLSRQQKPCCPSTFTDSELLLRHSSTINTAESYAADSGAEHRPELNSTAMQHKRSLFSVQCAVSSYARYAAIVLLFVSSCFPGLVDGCSSRSRPAATFPTGGSIAVGTRHPSFYPDNNSTRFIPPGGSHRFAGDSDPFNSSHNVTLIPLAPSSGSSNVPGGEVSMLEACPEYHKRWYCLNGARCFTANVHDVVLYNCICAEGWTGNRCQYRDSAAILEAAAASRSDQVLRTASIAGAVCVVIFFMALISLAAWIYIRKVRQIDRLGGQFQAAQQQQSNTSPPAAPATAVDSYTGSRDRFNSISRVRVIAPNGTSASPLIDYPHKSALNLTDELKKQQQLPSSFTQNSSAVNNNGTNGYAVRKPNNYLPHVDTSWPRGSSSLVSNTTAEVTPPMARPTMVVAENNRDNSSRQALLPSSATKVKVLPNAMYYPTPYRRSNNNNVPSDYENDDNEQQRPFNMV